LDSQTVSIQEIGYLCTRISRSTDTWDHFLR